MSTTAESRADLSEEQKTELEGKIKDKGDAIRRMKDEGISKEDLAPHITELLDLKAQLDPSAAAPKPAKKNKQQQKSKKKQQTDDVESDYITP